MNDAKRRWFLILFAFTALPVMLAVSKVAGPVTAAADAQSTTVFQGVPILALGAAVVWCVTRLRLKGEIGGAVELPAFPQFHVSTLIGLAFSEFASIAAYSTPGSTWQTMLPFLAGTIVVNLLFILPAGLAYFRALDEQGPGPDAPG